MATDQVNKIVVLADDDDLRPLRGLEYLDVGCVSQANIFQG